MGFCLKMSQNWYPSPAHSLSAVFLLFPTSLCGVLIFCLDPAGAPPPRPRPPPPPPPPHTHSLTHSLTSPHLTSPHLTSPHLTSPHLTSPHLTSPHLTSPHLTSLTHSHTHTLTHSHTLTLSHSHTLTLSHSLSHSLSLSLSLSHSLTHSLPPVAGAGAVQTASWLPFAWQAQYTEPPGGAAARVGAAGPQLAFAGAVHRASWKSCGARGRRWAAAGFRVAGAVHRASWLPFVWQAQYTEPPGGAAARVGAAAGFRVAGAVYTELPGCLSRGRRSTQSLLEELRRAWAPLGRGWLSHGKRSIHRASWLPFAWQAQYTEPPGWLARGRRSIYTELPGCLSRGRRSTQSLLHGGAAARVGAAGPRLAFAWQARYRESFLAAFRVAGAVHRASWKSCRARGRRWAAAGFAWQAQYRELLGCLSRGRRSTQSFLVAFRVAGTVHRASWRSCGARGRCWAAAGFCGRRSTESFLAASTAVDLSSPLITGTLITSQLLITTHHTLSRTKSWQLHFSHLTHHNSTAHHNSSHLHFSRVHFSSLLIATYHIPTHHSPTSHHNSSQLITSQLITAPLLTGPLLITTHQNFSQPNSWQFRFSHLTSHTLLLTSQLLITTHHNLSHPNSSQLHFSHPFSHPFSHLTYHIRTHHTSTSHTWHHKSTSHTSLLTPPRSLH